jgi:hypothetical protein
MRLNRLLGALKRRSSRPVFGTCSSGDRRRIAMLSHLQINPGPAVRCLSHLPPLRSSVRIGFPLALPIRNACKTCKKIRCCSRPVISARCINMRGDQQLPGDTVKERESASCLLFCAAQYMSIENLYGRGLLQAGRCERSANPGRQPYRFVRRGLTSHRPPTQPVDRRPDGGDLRLYPEFSNRRPWSPDGTRLAFISNRDGTGRSTSATDTGQTARITDIRGPPTSPGRPTASRRFRFPGSVSPPQLPDARCLRGANHDPPIIIDRSLTVRMEADISWPNQIFVVSAGGNPGRLLASTFRHRKS